ncbi:hypothetical protein NDI49_24060, partial [Trichocoleus sp. ST-U3]
LPLLKLPQEVLEALQTGRIEYTKAKAIALVKDETERQTLLEEAIAQSLSLSEIRERVKAVQPPTEPPPLASRIETISKLVKKHQVWDDPKKRKKLETLLAKIEELISPGELDESQPEKEAETTQNEPLPTALGLQDSSAIELSPDPKESHIDTTLAILSESSISPPETVEKPLEQDNPSSKSSDESRPLTQEELTEGSSELTESLTDVEIAHRLGVKTSTLGKAKKRTDFSSWSKSKDPDAIAWQWIVESKRFVPLER